MPGHDPLWLATLRDELAAARATRRARQVFPQRQLQSTGIGRLPTAAIGAGDDFILPDFRDPASLPVVTGSAYCFWVVPCFVPGFGAVPS